MAAGYKRAMPTWAPPLLFLAGAWQFCIGCDENHIQEQGGGITYFPVVSGGPIVDTNRCMVDYIIERSLEERRQ